MKNSVDFDVICCAQEANETIEARNGELDAKTEELKSVMKKLIETNAELSKVRSMNYDGGAG